ncbi:MAG: 30S ribosomal protein S16 [Lachnospiraceae bacterium]|nr:30S ribosomal protein S16 [Lachnospiraceae bacterium]
MVKIRLKRIGKKKAPFYRIIVSDAARTTQSTALAEIGTYDPLKEPSEVKINEEEARKWLSNGAQPTETVAKLFKKAGITK